MAQPSAKPLVNRSVPPLADRKTIPLRALFLGERIDLSSFRGGERLGVSPLVVPHGQGAAVLFRYGAVVFVGVEPVAQASLVRHVKAFVTEPFDTPEEEEVTLHVDPEHEERAYGDGIHIKEASVERVQVVADVLAKSVALAHHEQAVAEVFDRVEPLASSLQGGRMRDRSGKQLLAHIGSTLRVQTQMVARVGVTEKPDLLWERPDLELMYARIEDEFEVSERHLALERKLALIAQTAETLLEVLRHKHALRVEWYIVALIVFEIMLTLYAMFLGGGH